MAAAARFEAFPMDRNEYNQPAREQDNLLVEGAYPKGTALVVRSWARSVVSLTSQTVTTQSRTGARQLQMLGLEEGTGC